ncbi:hypothetical protein GGF42_007657 [Coemansia sp. RSA 2424]|nr:hypothetical protein GGF42_007657 [Coemansia sp. RSA 2424]
MLQLQQGAMPTPLMGSGMAPHTSPSAAMAAAAPATPADAAALGMQSPSAALASPSSAAATAAAAAAAAQAAAAATKKPAPARPKAKRASKKAAPGGAKSQATKVGVSPFMGAKPVVAAVGGNSGATSTNASASPALAIKASAGALAFGGMAAAAVAASDAAIGGPLGGARLDEGAFSSMLSQRGSKAALLQQQQQQSQIGSAVDFDFSAIGSLGPNMDDLFGSHQGLDMPFNDFMDMESSGNGGGGGGGGGDLLEDTMLAYNLGDSAELSRIIGATTAGGPNNGSVLALNLVGSVSGPANGSNAGNAGGDLTLPVNHMM